jgi:hypothetical protein
MHALSYTVQSKDNGAPERIGKIILELECLDGYVVPYVLDLELILFTEMAQTAKDRETKVELFLLELGDHLASAICKYFQDFCKWTSFGSTIVHSICTFVSILNAAISLDLFKEISIVGTRYF